MDYIKSVQNFTGSPKEPLGRMRIRNKYDQRYTCNAREVVACLRYTSNFRIVNRVVIMTNLRNYNLYLDTSFLEVSGYGLSDTVSFQVILNGGLSLAR
jgi:hypothetical protein